MNDIYECNNSEFNQSAVIDKLKDIAGELELEQRKPVGERDKNREFKILYKQFIEGLKLSTGSRIF